MADGRIIIDTELDNRGANKGIDNLNKSLGDVAKGGLKVFAGAITAVGTAVTALSGATVKIGMEFEAQMSRVKAIAGATSEEFQKLTDLAVALGASTVFSSTEVAQGMENLASAGFSVTEIMQAMPGMLDLAASAGEDLASSADIAASTLRGFGLDASYAGHVADVLAKNAADTNAAITDTGYAMKYIAPVARNAGWSLESVTAAIGAMADAGIKGEQAGTTLRGALTRLMRPAKSTAKAMDAIGFSAYDSSGKMKPLSQMITELGERTKDLTEEQRNFYIAQIFGTEALSGMTVLMQRGGAELDKMTESLMNADGAAAEMANTMQDNLKGRLEQLGGALETLAITAYQKFEGPMKSAVESATQAFENLGDSVKDGELSGSVERLAENFATLVSSVTNFVVAILPGLLDAFSWIMENGSYIAALVAAIGTAFMTFNVVSTITNLIGVLNGTSKAIGLVAKAQAALDVVMAMSPVGWVVIAVTALVAALVVLWNTNEGFRNAVIGAWNAILDAGKAVWGWLVTFFAETIPSSFQYALDKILEWGTSVTNFFTVTIPGWINFIDEWFKQLPYKIGYSLGYVAGAIAKWGFDTYTYFATNVPLWIESIGTWFYELPGRIGSALLATLINIGTWGINTYNSMKQSATDSVNEVVNYFATLPDRVWQWLLNAAAKLIAFKNDLGSKARDAGSSMVDNVVATVSSLPSKMLDIGLNIVRGLWDGIVGSKDWLFGKIGGFVTGIIDGFKSGFDIHSPSRIMEKLIGVNLIKGVGVGMDVETPNLEKDINDNVANLTAMMQGTVDYETARTTATVAARNQRYLGTDSIDTPDNNKPFPKLPDVHVHMEVEGKEVATAIAPYQDILDDYYKGR